LNEYTKYNVALAFVLLGEIREQSNVQSPHIFNFHAQLRHWFGFLLPNPEENTRYAQLYIVGPIEAIVAQMRHNPLCTQVTMIELLRYSKRNSHFLSFI
jgi:hypothetical protein